MNKSSYFPLRLLALIACIAAVFYACNDDSPVVATDTVSMSGFVTDAEGHPVPGAILEVHDVQPAVQAILAYDTTGEDGAFSLPDVRGKADALYVKVTHPSYQPFVGGLGELLRKAENGRVKLLLLHEDSCCGTVAMQVVDSTNLAAMQGVEVKLRRGGANVAVGTTDADGRVVFRHICAGEYNFRAAKQGFRVVEQNIALEDCDSLGLNIPMSPLGSNGDSCCHGVATVVVRDSTTNAALGNATVKLRKNGAVLTTLTTSSNGAVHFTGLCPGTYSLLILREGYGSYEMGFTVGCNDTIEVVRKLLATQNNSDSCCHGVAKVIVRDSTSNAVLGNSTVKLRKNGTLLTTLTTNNDGVVRFTGLCPGTYSLLIVREGYGSRELSFTVGCNDTVEVMRKLLATQTNGDSCCHGVATIVVRDSTTNGVLGNAAVKLRKNGAVLTTLTTSNNGVVHFTGLCPGTYSLLITREGYGSREVAFTVGCNDTIEVMRRLLATQNNNDTCCNNKIKIVARDSSTNQPLANTTVKLWKNGVVVATKTTNAEGQVVFEGLCSGTYGLNISKESYHGKELSVSVSCNSTEMRTISLWGEHSNADSCCHGMIKIVVRDSTSNAIISNSTVKLWKGNQQIATETTNGDGVVIFRNLCAGQYQFSIKREHYKGSEATVQLGCNDTLNITKRILAESNTCETAKLKLRLKDSTTGDGVWLSGVTVVIKRNGQVVAQGTTGAEGWYLREGLLAPAEYTVTFSKDGFVSKTVTFVFNECKLLQETIRLIPE